MVKLQSSDIRKTIWKSLSFGKISIQSPPLASIKIPFNCIQHQSLYHNRSSHEVYIRLAHRCNVELATETLLAQYVAGVSPVDRQNLTEVNSFFFITLHPRWPYVFSSAVYCRTVPRVYRDLDAVFLLSVNSTLGSFPSDSSVSTHQAA